MARFQIEKGERFSLNKSEGLEKVQIDLNWKSGADLDASAFLVGEDGLIGDDADFVFYNSKNRANPKTGEFEPFDKAVHGNEIGVKPGKIHGHTHSYSPDGVTLP